MSPEILFVLGMKGKLGLFVTVYVMRVNYMRMLNQLLA